jgi:RNA polymerase sigma-70 factor (ECF subfamily)
MVAFAEAQLLRDAVAGDEGAFEALIAPLAEPAYRLALSMLSDPEEAADAVQEASIRAWRKLHQVRPGLPVRPWFLAIVANRCRSVRRSHWFSMPRVAGPAEIVDPPDDGPLSALEVRLALATLGREDRAALFLRYYLDLPQDEIATVLGISVAAARSRVSRAVQRLRQELTS